MKFISLEAGYAVGSTLAMGASRLLKQTSGFKVKKTFYSAAGIPRLSGAPPMNLEVEFTHLSPDEPIRIDVDFGKLHIHGHNKLVPYEN
jgi:hypothetical protein